ncbi:MAG: hypothetical protein B7Z66_01015 [Chromatiales bacterium 21-64-14]|nr:MAG: hypothetical protein B7Z66_01015 [Chromatiales bacterium 21-64-14]HQU16048.1 hypothetical protein [Gammaproteobacteria bacterium]
MQPLVKQIKLNNVQYHLNRDPEFYRRTPDQEFRVQAFLDGSGTVDVQFEAEDRTLCETRIPLPGMFDCRFRFDTPGTRIGTLTITQGDETRRREIRLDVNEHHWIG